MLIVLDNSDNSDSSFRFGSLNGFAVLEGALDGGK